MQGTNTAEPIYHLRGAAVTQSIFFTILLPLHIFAPVCCCCFLYLEASLNHLRQIQHNKKAKQLESVLCKNMFNWVRWVCLTNTRCNEMLAGWLIACLHYVFMLCKLTFKNDYCHCCTLIFYEKKKVFFKLLKSDNTSVYDRK